LLGRRELADLVTLTEVPPESSKTGEQPSKRSDVEPNRPPRRFGAISTKMKQTKIPKYLHKTTNKKDQNHNDQNPNDFELEHKNQLRPNLDCEATNPRESRSSPQRSKTNHYSEIGQDDRQERRGRKRANPRSSPRRRKHQRIVENNCKPAGPGS